MTAIRTAAASAAATDVLARPDSQTLAVVGAGVQAREHIAAIRCERGIRAPGRHVDINGLKNCPNYGSPSN